MTISFSPALAATLAAAPTKTAWVAAVVQALGSNRTATAKRAASGDAWATGDTFRAAALTGSVTSTAGSISSFGNIGAVTTQAAADLSTGVSVVRIASADGTAWVQGTLGLAGSGADWTLRASPTTANGFGFGASFKLTAPTALPGAPPAPVAIPPSSQAPARVKLWDWTTGSAVLAGTLPIDTALADLTPSHADLEADLGTVPVAISSADVFWDTFKWGVLRTTIGPEANAESSADNIYEIAVSASPAGRWSQYPAYGGYVQATDRTIPRAFKVTIENAAGATLHTFQNPDGSAINSQTTYVRDTSNPLRPYWVSGQWMVWRSARAKLSNSINKWHPGLRPAYADNARDGREGASTNGPIPLLGGRFQIKSANHFWAAPQFGLPVGAQTNSPNGSDPFLFSDNYSGDGGYQAWLAVGWDYVPGRNGLHDIYTGPGGVRWDRAGINSTYALLATDPNFVRPKGSIPIRTLAEAWGLNGFNRAVHFLRDARTFAGIPKAQIFEVGGGWSLGYDTYYGGVPTYVPGGEARNVQMFPPPRDRDWTTVDPNGRYYYNGDLGGDSLHNYFTTHYDTALMLRSAISMIGARHAFDMATMAMLSDRIGTQTDTFGRRSQSWVWAHIIRGWCTAANHPLTHSQADFEALFVRELESTYDRWYVPTVVDSNPATIYACIRNLGFPMWDAPSGGPGGSAYPFSENSTYWAYIAIPYMHLKVSGLWAVMRAKSNKCLTVIDWMGDCLDKFCCSSIAATQGRFMDAPDRYETFSTAGLLTRRTPTPVLPTSWVQVEALTPRVGLENLIRTEAGNLRERTGTMHIFAQWAYMRRDFYPEVTNPDIAAVCALWDGWYAEWRGAGQGFPAAVPGNGPFRIAA